MDFEDAKDLPIELRRFEDNAQNSMSVNVKSKSLGSILSVPIPKSQKIVRSRSSVPSLNYDPYYGSHNSDGLNVKKSRPKLIKQKQSVTDYTTWDEQQFDPQEISHKNIESRSSLFRFRKQSSLNEELMASSRIREKERIRKKIQKQMSLNETFLCRSILTKRLQIILNSAKNIR